MATYIRRRSSACGYKSPLLKTISRRGSSVISEGKPYFPLITSRTTHSRLHYPSKNEPLKNQWLSYRVRVGTLKGAQVYCVYSVLAERQLIFFSRYVLLYSENPRPPLTPSHHQFFSCNEFLQLPQIYLFLIEPPSLSGEDF